MIEATGIVVAASMVAAVTHGYIFVRESTLFTRTSTLRMFEVRPENAAAVRLWAFHLGVYNLLLGCMMLTGAVALVLESTVVAHTLVIAAGTFMVVAAVALLAADRRRSRATGLIAQAAPPLVAIVAILLH